MGALGSADLARERDRLAREYGPWHDRISLPGGVPTVDGPAGGEDRRTHALLQVVADTLDHEPDQLRILDLGAAEGRHAVEFASHGAEVVAWEGRHGSAEKLRFVKRVLGLDALEVIEGDVRELSAEVHGRFDVVLCLGLLYHLDGPAAVRLRRSALGNPASFWFTRASLLNLLSDAGFTSALELQSPRYHKPADRLTLLALRGQHRTVVSAPGADRLEPERWPERERRHRHPGSTWRGTLKLALAPYAPRAVKERARRRRER